MFEAYAPDFDVKVQGLSLEADVRRSTLDVAFDNHLDSADMFELLLNDPGARYADSALFAVGKTVEIHLGYAGRLRPMMLGEITALQPSFPAAGAPTLSITGYDKSHRLRHNTPARPPFLLTNDSLIAAQIALENLLIPVVDPSPLPPQAAVPQDCSDFALLKRLADRNGFEVSVAFDKLFFRLPRPQTDRVVLEWGRTLGSFTPRLSTAGQAGLQVVRGYDEELAQAIVAVLPAVGLGGSVDDLIERVGGSFVDQLATLGRRVANDQPVGNFLDATLLAKSLLTQLLEGLYEGSGTCPGNPDLRAGDQVEIRGIGRRFSGTYRLRQVRHSIGANGYETRFEVTQKYSCTLLESLREKLVEKPSPNHPEKVPGVAVARVENNVDPLGLGRVQLSFPHLSDVNLSGFARVATLWAGDGAGSYFVPDVGDEVLVAFERGELSRPVVLGGLWSLKRRPPVGPVDAARPARTIATRAGHRVTLDDTPGQEQVVVEDASGCRISLGPRGDVEIRAARTLTLADPVSSIALDGQGTVTIAASNVKVQVGGTMDVGPPGGGA